MLRLSSLALVASACLLAQAPTSQRITASAAGVDLHAARTVFVQAVSADAQHPESRDHLERVRTAALGGLKGTSLEPVHDRQSAQAVLLLTVAQAGEHHAGDAVAVLLREAASGRVLYCAAERGMKQGDATRDLMTQMNTVITKRIAAPGPAAMDACVSQAGGVQ